MNIRTIYTYVITLLLGLSFCAKANASLGLGDIDSVTSSKNCFSSPFSSHDLWFDTLYSKKKKVFAMRKVKNAERRLLNFKQGFYNMFPKESFEQAKRSLDCRFFTYKVNDKNVKGVLIKPKTKENTQVPVIVYNRGGTRNYGELVFGHLAYQLFPLAQKGYAIIASDYREDEQYGADNIEEVTALLELIKNVPGVSSEKVGVLGISRGGLTSLQLAKEVPNKIGAMVTINGVTDGRLWAQNREGIAHNISLITGYKQDKEAVFDKLSPVKWVEKVSAAPIMIVHARDDDKVNVMHSLRLANELTSLNRKYQLEVYESGGHGLDEFRTEILSNMDVWFSKYLN